MYHFDGCLNVIVHPLALFGLDLRLLIKHKNLEYKLDEKHE